MAIVSDWLGDRHLPWVGTNAGAQPLPFQRWHHFKEAFAPELVSAAINMVRPALVFDPFGGSGTTALTCQFFGIDVLTLEVNPFLADVITAKLAKHKPSILREQGRRLVLEADSRPLEARQLPDGAPRTLIEPGHKDRFVFHRDAAAQLLALAHAIDDVPSDESKAFYRTILGSCLVELSNVVVNGKGRRYRRGWAQRSDPGRDGVNQVFLTRLYNAIEDVEAFGDRQGCAWVVERTDARRYEHTTKIDLTVCSPPYPNSFDYTDVYNLELWMLGYLTSGDANRQLRSSTISSHVQLHRQYASPPNSPLLDATFEMLSAIADDLWNRHIPAMIGAYFAELQSIFSRILSNTREGGQAWIVVGDSRYNGVHVPVAKILCELLTASGWHLIRATDSRSMRSSAQQGGQHDLAETLLIVER